MDTINMHILEHKSFWGTSEELLDRSWRLAKALSLNYAKINLRLVRYYTTEGVLDKPDRLGREAAYNTKHILQLILARQLAEKNTPLESIKLLTQRLSVEQLINKIQTPIEEVKDEIKKISFERIKSTQLLVQKKPENSAFDLENRLSKIEVEVINNLTKEIECLRYDLGSFKDQINMNFSEQMAKIWNELGAYRAFQDKFMNEMDLRLKFANEEYSNKINHLQKLENEIDAIIKKRRI